jgi:hypothetical protein
MKGKQIQAEQLLRSLVDQVVTACVDYKYRLDKDGNTTWTKAWTFQSGFLFTMTTLATIGYSRVPTYNPTGISYVHKYISRGNYYYTGICIPRYIKSYLPIPWRDSISRPMAPQAETIPLDHAIRAETLTYCLEFDKYRPLL